MKPKRLDAAFLLRLVHGQRVNFLFDAAKLFVDHIISIVRRLVLRKGIQNTQMPRRVHQALIVVLAMNVDKSTADVAHHRRCCRHAVDAASAFPLCRDLTIEKQLVLRFIARVRKLGACLCADSAERGPYHGFGRVAAHDLSGSSVPQNSVD